MKKFFRNINLVIFTTFLFIGSIDAASIIGTFNPTDIFHRGITPAPKIIIPFVPVTPVINDAGVSVSSALKEFKSLSKSEKKGRIREAKAQLKEYKKQSNSSSQPSTNQLLLVILAIILPPLAVYLHEGRSIRNSG